MNSGSLTWIPLTIPAPNLAERLLSGPLCTRRISTSSGTGEKEDKCLKFEMPKMPKIKNLVIILEGVWLHQLFQDKAGRKTLAKERKDSDRFVRLYLDKQVA